jgi:hypothetical protein
VSGDATLNVALHSVVIESGLVRVGPQLASFTFEDANTDPHIATAVNTDPNMELIAGTSYWLGLVSESDGVHEWYRGNTVVGRIARTLNGGQSYSYGGDFRLAAFEVQVVPEPCALFALGLGVVPILRKRRKHEAT